MRNLLLLLVGLSLFSCKNEEKKEALYQSQVNDEGHEAAGIPADPSAALGKEIFDGKGNCFSCHKADQKIIGPSVVEIAKIYQEKKGNMVKFLKEEADPIVDPANYSMMKPNFYITKNFTDKELKGLEDYFYSHLKK